MWASLSFLAGPVFAAQDASAPVPEPVAAVTIDDMAQWAAEFRLPLLVGASALVLVMLWAGDVIKPGSLKRAGLRDVKALPAPVWLFCALVVMLSMPLALGAVQSAGWADASWLGAGDSQVQPIAVPMLFGGVAGVLVALGMSSITAKSAGSAGLKLLPADLPMGLGLFILALPIILLLGTAAEAAHAGLTGGDAMPDKIAHPTLRLIVDNASDPWSWVIIAFVVLAVPIVEEFAYRAFLQTAIFHATNQVWAGILITSTVFAAMHLWGAGGGGEGEEARAAGVPWYAAVAIFGVGLSCGLAYERTRRIGVPIAMHAAFNALNVAYGLAGASSG